MEVDGRERGIAVVGVDPDPAPECCEGRGKAEQVDIIEARLGLFSLHYYHRLQLAASLSVL